LYDYNDDGLIDEEEWLDAQIQLNQYYILEDFGEVSNADLSDFEANGFSLAEFSFFDGDANNEVDLNEWCIGMKAINTFEFLLNGSNELHDDDDNMNYDSTFDIDMDGEITNEEFILGMTWMNEYLVLNPSGGEFLVSNANDDDLESYLLASEELDLRQWLKFKSYVSNWNLMIADQNPPSDELDAVRLV
jgi:hypothetical protein